MEYSTIYSIYEHIVFCPKHEYYNNIFYNYCNCFLAYMCTCLSQVYVLSQIGSKYRRGKNLIVRSTVWYNHFSESYFIVLVREDFKNSFATFIMTMGKFITTTWKIIQLTYRANEGIFYRISMKIANIFILFKLHPAYMILNICKHYYIIINQNKMYKIYFYIINIT